MNERTLLDVAFVRRRRAELGLSIRAISAQVGLSTTSYTMIENGHGHEVVTLDTVLRLARALGTTVDGLMVGAGAEAKDIDEDDDDPARLGAVLFAVGKLTPVGTLLEVLDWSLDRLHQAEGRLAQTLGTCGMALRRNGNQLAITGAVDAVDTGTLEAAVRRHLHRDHLSVTEARLLRQVEHGDVPTQPSNPERVAMQTLVNAGLVMFASPAAKNTEAPMVLSDDVRYSLLLDEDPDASVPPRRRRRSVASVAKA